MTDYRAIRDQVEDYLGEWAGDYDVDAIVDEISESPRDYRTIDDIDPDDWQDLIDRHEFK